MAAVNVRHMAATGGNSDEKRLRVWDLNLPVVGSRPVTLASVRRYHL